SYAKASKKRDKYCLTSNVDTSTATESDSSSEKNSRKLRKKTKYPKPATRTEPTSAEFNFGILNQSLTREDDDGSIDLPQVEIPEAINNPPPISTPFSTSKASTSRDTSLINLDTLRSVDVIPEQSAFELLVLRKLESITQTQKEILVEIRQNRSKTFSKPMVVPGIALPLKSVEEFEEAEMILKHNEEAHNSLVISSTCL
ncbi:unnamed protein product, partial [Allacma fusca]